MVQTVNKQAPETSSYTVLRAICMGGERVEVGETVELTPLLYAELRNAGKVGPLVEKPKRAPKQKTDKEESKDEAPAASEGQSLLLPDEATK